MINLTFLLKAKIRQANHSASTMLRKDDIFILYTGERYKYKTMILDELKSCEEIILKQLGLYPKNMEIIMGQLNTHDLSSGRPWLFGQYLDQKDMEFLRDKINPNVFNQIILYTNLDINYIKHLIDAGIPNYTFSILNGIIRRTYKDLYDVIGGNFPPACYVKPKNEIEKKYFKMMLGVHIANSNRRHNKFAMAIILKYSQ